MASHICLLVELGPICNFMAASLCLKSCEDHSLLKSYNRGLWKNNYIVALPFDLGTLIHDHHANSLHILSTRRSYGQLANVYKWRIWSKTFKQYNKWLFELC